MPTSTKPVGVNIKEKCGLLFCIDCVIIMIIIIIINHWLHVAPVHFTPDSKPMFSQNSSTTDPHSSHCLYGLGLLNGF